MLEEALASADVVAAQLKSTSNIEALPARLAEDPRPVAPTRRAARRRAAPRCADGRARQFGSCRELLRRTDDEPYRRTGGVAAHVGRHLAAGAAAREGTARRRVFA